MRIAHSYTERRPVEMMMTPLIDVVFLLLIFFICTASFQIPEQVMPASLLGAGSTAPEIKIEPEIVLERIVVKVQPAQGGLQWIVNERPCESLLEVRQRLAQIAQIDVHLPVILDPAAPVPLGEVIDIYDICRLLGFDKIQFATSAQL